MFKPSHQSYCCLRSILLEKRLDEKWEGGLQQGKAINDHSDTHRIPFRPKTQAGIFFLFCVCVVCVCEGGLWGFFLFASLNASYHFWTAFVCSEWGERLQATQWVGWGPNDDTDMTTPLSTKALVGVLAAQWWVGVWSWFARWKGGSVVMMYLIMSGRGSLCQRRRQWFRYNAPLAKAAQPKMNFTPTKRNKVKCTSGDKRTKSSFSSWNLQTNYLLRCYTFHDVLYDPPNLVLLFETFYSILLFHLVILPKTTSHPYRTKKLILNIEAHQMQGTHTNRFFTAWWTSANLCLYTYSNWRSTFSCTRNSSRIVNANNNLLGPLLSFGDFIITH